MPVATGTMGHENRLFSEQSLDKSFTEYLDGFASYMESSTRLLPVTRQRYRYEVAAFAALIGNPSLRDTTPRMLLDWNARFHQAGAAASTVIQKHSALRKFFGYLAKSLFLWDIERVFGARALWLLGSATSQAGMWDLVAEHQPDVLLLDEFEKIKGVDQAALLSLMEGGRLVRAKVGRGLNLNLECRVFAAANTMRGLTPEILSRFARRELRPYSQAEFQEVVTSVMVKREGVDATVAAEIAASLAGRTQDVRDAIRVARLSQQMDPRRAIELLGVA
jgi:hypothetical protein